jgi:hypothetical protein
MTDLAWMRPKLAELCGLDPYTDRREPDKPCYVGLTYWHPDEDVAQAVRCLEAMRKNYLTRLTGPTKAFWRCDLINDYSAWVEVDESLPRAICLAIAAALGWEKP